jgi:hypothetical protein
MQVIRPVGREAAAKKYDILSAMMAHALAGDQHRQRLILRLMALITTRYNWQRNELATGQREIARLWCVDERTVKRDMARLRGLGWVQVKRAGARGRVSVLGLDLERIMLDTRPEWSHIGEDFVARVGQGPQPAESTVVPFRRPDPVPGDGVWPAICDRLGAEDPALCDAWFRALREAGIAEGRLTLIAPSRFHATYVRTHLLGRLKIAARRHDGSIADVVIDTL